MKKKLFGIIAIAAVIVFSLVSCGSGNSANPQELVGKWEYQSGYSPFSGYDEVELFRDGTGVVSGGGFSWKVVDKRLVITHPLFALACNYKVSGPTVTLFYDNGKSGTFINRKSPGGKSAGNAPEVLGGFGSRLSALFGGGGEYTIHFSEDVEGVIMVFKDAGKIIIRSSASEGFSIDNTLCPILPKDQSFYVYSYGETIIDGNTTTWTDHDGLVCKTVTAGNTTTLTDHDGSLIYKKVKDGNTTTTTYPNGTWRKEVKEGNTTTETDQDGNWWKTVKNGNTTTWTDYGGTWRKRVVTKKGRDIFVEVTRGIN